jgi:hypothetical protein
VRAAVELVSFSEETAGSGQGAGYDLLNGLGETVQIEVMTHAHGLSFTKGILLFTSSVTVALGFYLVFSKSAYFILALRRTTDTFIGCVLIMAIFPE